MDPILRVGAIAAAITAVVVATRTVWRLFVEAVKTAVSEEMNKFHSELNSYDEFWTERLDRLERAVQVLENRSKQLFDMVNPTGESNV
jgi:hypothetical protein